jgi:uncharacterized membrane protein/uncharacterized membrane protein YeaQ/YmgE (transglycosylase-associated protein family)
MHAIVWVISGLAAGCITSAAMGQRGHRRMLGEVALGLLGAVLTESLFRVLGITAPGTVAAHAVLGLAGATLFVVAARALDRVAEHARVPAGARALKSAITDLEAHVRRLADGERRVLARLLHCEHIALDTAAVFEERSTLGERLADRVATFGGSWGFIFCFIAMMLVWINVEEARPFDPYPFILLNLVLSCLAALQAPVIMMSQNRLAAKDRLDAHHDYEINLKAEMEIASLHLKLDTLREEQWQQLVTVQAEQLAVLARIERALEDLQRAAAPPAPSSRLLAEG